MNGADSSDDENGVLYFLPGGIADDSPPRRTLDMSSPVPSSFGYIGAAQSSTTTTQNFRMTPVAATEPNNSLLSGLGGVAVPNKPAARDRPLGGGGFGSFGGYGYGGRFGGSPGESSTPANGGGVGSIGSSSFLGPNTNAGASSSQPIQTPSSSTFARSPFMSTTTSSSGGPLRAPPGLDIPLPSAAGSSFLQPQHRMLDRKDESLRAAFGFLQHSSPAPTTHLEQPPPATASNMFGRSGYQQSNKDLAELNTTSVVVVQKPPSRLHLEDQHDYGTGSNSIGVHRFRNTFLEPPPSDDLGTSPSSHPPPVPVRAGSTPRVTGGGRPYGSEPKERGKDKFHGKRHGSPSSASSFDSDVHAAPSSSTLNSTPSSPMHFVDQRPASSSPHVAAQPQRVVPGQIRIKQRGGDGMSPKKPTAEVPVASGPQRTSSRGAATSTAVPPPHSTRRPLYREKFPKGAPSSDGPPPLATVPKSDRSTPRRGTRADKSLVSGGAAAPPSIPTDVASTTTTTTNTRRTATKANPVQQARPHVSPRRENLYNSLLVDEPIAAPVLEVEGEGPTAPDESTDGDEMVSQDGRGDDDPSSIPAVANKASNVEDDNVCVGRDDSDEDGSAQDNVSTSADTSPSSSPREERLKTHDDAATPDDLPPLEEDVMTPGPSPIACHDDSSDKPEVVASATPPQPQEFHPPSSEDDMPARPPSSSKKRSDKKSRRTTDASSAVSGAAKGSVDKRKGDGSGLKQPSSSHKKQDPHGKNDADGSGAHPTGSPPPQRTPDDDDDDDDLFAPVPRSAWSVAKSAVVSTCVWLVAFSGASTGLPWLLVHAHWLASTLLSLAFHCGFHVLSFGLKFHRFVVRGLIFNRNIASCFAFLYLFPLLVQYVIPWAPPWAPVCLWYAFLVQLFCTQGSTAMVATFRILLPLVFLVEGVSHHSFLLDLNGAELLLISFILSAVKTGNLYSPVFFLSMSLQCLSAVFLGSEMFVQWIQLAVALYSLHAMASDEWGDVEDNTTSFSQSSSPFLGSDVHHPSGTSIQKTKRLDRRSMAAVVKGRKPRAASST